MSEPIKAIWVISDCAPDGTYVTTIQAGDDSAVTLDRTQAIRYAMTVIDASVRALYDAAVFAQMAKLGMEERTAVEPVIQLRADRPPLADDATSPLRFEPILTSRKKEAVIHVHLNGEPISEWTPDEAMGHALHVLEVAVGVDLDSAYRRILVGLIGLNDNQARAAVGDLINHRPN